MFASRDMQAAEDHQLRQPAPVPMFSNRFADRVGPQTVYACYLFFRMNKMEGSGLVQLEYYYYLLEIDRCSSISGAARTLGMPQATLSSIVGSLEREFGFSIFYHSKNGMVPTAKGEKLLAAARGINIKAEELYALANQTKANTQPIRILMSRGASVGTAVELACRYHDFDLHGYLVFEECPRTEIPSMLMRYAANIALALFPAPDVDYYRPQLEHNDISVDVIYSSRYYLLCSKQHPLATGKKLTDDIFQAESFCTITGSGTSDISSIFQRLTSKCRYLVSVTNYSLMRELVVEENMIGLHNWYTLCTGHVYDPDRMAIIPLSKDLSPRDVRLCFLHRNSQYLRYQERILVNCLKEYFQELHLPVPPEVDRAVSTAVEE